MIVFSAIQSLLRVGVHARRCNLIDPAARAGLDKSVQGSTVFNWLRELDSVFQQYETVLACNLADPASSHTLVSAMRVSVQAFAPRPVLRAQLQMLRT